MIRQFVDAPVILSPEEPEGLVKFSASYLGTLTFHKANFRKPILGQSAVDCSMEGIRINLKLTTYLAFPLPPFANPPQRPN